MDNIRHGSWDYLLVTTDPQRTRLSLPGSVSEGLNHLGVPGKGGGYGGRNGARSEGSSSASSLETNFPRSRSFPLVDQSPITDEKDVALMGSVRARAGAGGRRSETSHSSSSSLLSHLADEMVTVDRKLTEAVDLSQLSSYEQEKVRSVLEQALQADEDVARHGRYLQDQQLLMVRKSAKSIPGSCPLCLRSLILLKKTLCSMCPSVVCENCLRNVSVPSSDEVMSICKLCFVRRRIVLSTCSWRDEAPVDQVEDEPSTSDDSVPGYGLTLVCGLKSDGGVLRTFVIDSPPDGAANRSGVNDGYEIVSWCGRSLVGRNFHSVCEIIRHACLRNIRLKTRQYLADGRLYEEEHRINTPSTVSPSYFVHRMLANPDAIGFPDGLSQVISNSEPLYRPYGRIELRLGFDGADFMVAIIRAECLPSFKPGVPPNPAVTIAICDGEQFSTSERRRTQNPVWDEEIALSITQKKLTGCKLRVSVTTPKTFFGRLTLGVCEICLDEAVLDHTSQWYTLQPHTVRANAVYLGLSPDESLTRAVMAAHFRKVHDSQTSNPSMSSLCVQYQQQQHRWAGSMSPAEDPRSSPNDRKESAALLSSSPADRQQSITLLPGLSPTGFAVGQRPKRIKPNDRERHPSSARYSSADGYHWSQKPTPSHSMSSLNGDESGTDLDFGTRHQEVSPTILLTPVNTVGQSLGVEERDGFRSATGRTRSGSVASAILQRSTLSARSSLSASNDNLSMISSGSVDSLGEVSVANYTGGVLQDATVALTLVPQSTNMRVMVGKVDKVHNLIQMASLKDSEVAGVGVKVSMHAVGASKLKRKTSTMPLASGLDFNAQFDFNTSITLSLYTLRIQVVAKMKKRSLLKRKSTVLAYCLLPFQDRDLALGQPQREHVNVFAKSKKL
ncbi:uncharacterized protein LOC135814852 isoform X1 [Sycon ciliatum]|uniref:uncharacterized protein LOC135814852 isoform X1 n=2 Tax=Sycon ciliatum TaxID=27933 RepID=UPI0031F6337C